MEFKVLRLTCYCRRTRVLIESDWNLKSGRRSLRSGVYWVLIESDWNLKVTAVAVTAVPVTVLIESDWNLKLSRKLTADL